VRADLVVEILFVEATPLQPGENPHSLLLGSRDERATRRHGAGA
jgi:hypothetical protein